MHEFSVAQSIFDLVIEVARRERMSPVQVVKVRIGRLSCIDRDALCLAYATIAQETPLAGSQLQVTPVEPKARCLECGHEFDFPEDFSSHCPRCEQVRIDIVAGREMIIESIEGEIENGSQSAAEHSQGQ